MTYVENTPSEIFVPAIDLEDATCIGEDWVRYFAHEARSDIARLAETLIHDPVRRFRVEIEMLKAAFHLARYAPFDPDRLYCELVDVAHSMEFGTLSS